MFRGDVPSPKGDWDVASDAPPERMMKLFRRAIPTGIAHGTVTVMVGQVGIEVTTLRGESTYSDGRHPDQVVFVQRIEDDLLRRDFTVNALAFDPLSSELIDPTGGVADIQQRILRAVGEPAARFGEDGLRVLRAARFAATLEYALDEPTRAAILPSLGSYRKVSPERIRDEWMKSLGARCPSRAFELMRDHGMLAITAPELLAMAGCEQNRYHAYDVWEHTMRVVDGLNPNQPLLRLGALVHDIAKPVVRATNPETNDYTFYNHEQRGAKMAGALLMRLHFSGDEQKYVSELVRHHLVVYDRSWTDAAVRRWLRRVSPELCSDILALCRADIVGKGREVADELSAIEQLARRVEEVVAAGAALGTKDLRVNGTELMERLGLAPGPLIGRLQRALLDDVIESPEHNERERLLERARAHLASWLVPEESH